MQGASRAGLVFSSFVRHALFLHFRVEMIPPVPAKPKLPMILILMMMIVRAHSISSLIFSSSQGVLEGEHQTNITCGQIQQDEMLAQSLQSRQTKITEF